MSLFFLDTNVLSNFANVQRGDLLQALLRNDAATTPAVVNELQQGETMGRIPVCDWSWLTIVSLSDEEEKVTTKFRQQVGAGEAECIAVAITRQGIFCSDDFAARRLARHDGVSVSGTVGVLVALVEEKLLPAEEAEFLLQEMVRYGYHSPVDSLMGLLRLDEKSPD